AASAIARRMISRKIRMKLLLRHQWPQQRTIVAYLERPGEGQNQTPEVACIGPWHETADHIFICVKVALGAERACCVGGWRIRRSTKTKSGHGPDRNHAVQRSPGRRMAKLDSERLRFTPRT